jgi:hypothetical protein
MVTERTCGECREPFPEHLFAPVTTSAGTKTVCPLCAWMAVCSAHGVPPPELLPQGEQASRMVHEAARIVRSRGTATNHPARELLDALPGRRRRRRRRMIRTAALAATEETP